MPGMNTPFKFFVHTPAHFLPDPATPVAQPAFQSMGCQAAMSPLSMVGTPIPASGTPQAAPSDAFGVSASPVALQVPATFMPQVSGSAFTDVSSRYTGGSPVVYQSIGDQGVAQGYTSGSPVVYGSGQLMMSGGAPMAVVPGPVPSLGASTPLSPVPAAFLSGHSVGTPVAVVPHATSDLMASAAARVPMPRLEDGTSTTMTTGTKFSTPKAAKNKKKQKGNRCLCF